VMKVSDVLQSVSELMNVLWDDDTQL
jgi:hypothetical protein